MNEQAVEPIEILFYYRQDCDLCEQMEFELSEYIATFHAGADIRVELRDVDDDRRWHEKYGEYVPAVVVNGKRICHYFFDCDAVRLALE